jgi:magnesium transporter
MSAEEREPDLEPLDAQESPFTLGEPELRARCHAYADTGTGPHGVSLEDAVAFFLDPEAPAAWARDKPPFVWIDVASPGPREAEFLRGRLRFHPLAVEDCIRGRQRPKLDRYPGYYFLVLYAARINAERKRMALTEVHLFVGRHYIVTVHDQKISEFQEVLARWRAAPSRYCTVGALAHAILDTIVDDYFPVIDHFAERTADVEMAVFGQSSEEVMQQILAMRRELTLFRRVVGPTRDLLASLVRRDLPFLSSELQLYFQDVFDHAMRVVEEIDTLRDLLSAALEGQLSLASNQLNVTMRVMAAWSIILMAMAWIAGVYGMNFAFMPELHWRLGYPFALGTMLAVGTFLFVYFRHRRWI